MGRPMTRLRWCRPAVALLTAGGITFCDAVPSNVIGRQVMAEGKPVVLKGVNWNPVPVGSTQAQGVDFRGFVEADSALMEAAGINAVRTYSPIVDKEVLDILWHRGIHVLNTVYVSGKHDVGTAAGPVERVKDHPAILMWCVGNEWNYNHLYSSSLLFDDALKRVAEASKLIKRLDPTHVVATIYGMLPPPDQITALDHVDVWGLTAYTGISFGGLFQRWAERTGKPMFLAEFGADAYNALTKVEDEGSQAHATTVLAQEIAKHSILQGGICSGGLIFELADEWWKDVEGSPDRQDVGGIAPGGGPYPDHVFNEEYWGLVKIDGSPRQAFAAYAAFPPAGHKASTIRSGFRLRACGASPKCSGMLGNCCPNADGKMHSCCSEEARSAMTDEEQEEKEEKEEGKEACKVEHNFDYWGQDLHILMGIDSFEACSQHCSSNPQCKSFTYGKVGYFAHLCFLKKVKMPNRTPNTCCDSGLPCREADSTPPEQAKGTTLASTTVTTTTLEETTLVPTTTITLVPTTTILPTFPVPPTLPPIIDVTTGTSVRSTSRTVTTSRTPTATTTTGTQTSTTSLTLTTSLTHRTTEVCQFDRDYDYLGDDLTNIMYVAAAKTCAALCYAHPSCRSFSYAKKIQGCFLKSTQRPHRRADGCCDSGLPCAQACLLEPNYDYAGDDLASIGNVKSAEECANMCFGHALCRSFTYGKNFKHKHVCFLKSSVMPGRTFSNCCDSGLPCAPQAPTTTHHDRDHETSALLPSNPTTTTEPAKEGTWVGAQLTSHNEFVVALTIGSPPQAMRCLVDSGSADLWIPSMRCRNCGSLNTFKASTSNSFHAEGPAPKSGPAGSFDWPDSVKLNLGGGKIVGYPVKDTVRLGSVEVLNQSFIIVEDSTMPEDRHWDGICGLGWQQLGKVHNPLYTRIQDRDERALFALVPMGSGRAVMVIGAVPHTQIKDKTLVWVSAESFQPGTMSKWVQRTFWVTTGGLQIHKTRPVPSRFLIDTGIPEVLLAPPKHYDNIIQSLLPLGALGGICRVDRKSREVICDCTIKQADLLPLQIYLGGRPFLLHISQLFKKVQVDGQEQCKLQIRPNPKASSQQGGMLEGLGGLLGGLMSSILGSGEEDGVHHHSGEAPVEERIPPSQPEQQPGQFGLHDGAFHPWHPPVSGPLPPQAVHGGYGPETPAMQVPHQRRRLEGGWRNDLLADLISPQRQQEDEKKSSSWVDVGDPLDELWVLGGGFVRHYVTIFDFDKALLGFGVPTAREDPDVAKPVRASPDHVQRLQEEVVPALSDSALFRERLGLGSHTLQLTLAVTAGFFTLGLLLLLGLLSPCSSRGRLLHRHSSSDAVWRELQMMESREGNEIQFRYSAEAEGGFAETVGLSPPRAEGSPERLLPLQ